MRKGCPNHEGGFVGGSASVRGEGYQLLEPLREGVPIWGKEGQALKGALGAKEGLAEGWATGEGFRIHRSLYRGGSLEGNMCSGTSAIPRGRVESRAWAVCRNDKVSTLRRRGRIP